MFEFPDDLEFGSLRVLVHASEVQDGAMTMAIVNGSLYNIVTGADLDDIAGSGLGGLEYRGRHCVKVWSVC